MKMSRLEKRNSTEVLCRQMSNVVIDMVIEELAENLSRSDDGSLSIAQLHGLGRTIKNAENDDHIIRMRRMAGNWLNAAQRQTVIQNRNQALERLLIGRIAHMFPPNESLSSTNALSRRVIPALMKVLEQEVGSVHLFRCRGDCQDLYDQERTKLGKRFSWEGFERNSAAQAIADEVLLRFACTFDDFEFQMMRVVGQLNRNLDLPESYEFEGPDAARWTLKERAFIEMMRALYGMVCLDLESENSREKMTAEFGDDVVAQVIEFLSTLQRSHENTMFAQRSHRKTCKNGKRSVRYWPRY